MQEEAGRPSRRQRGAKGMGFVREADMLAPLLSWSPELRLPAGAEPYFEVQTSQGVVDLLLVVLDEAVVAARRATGLPALAEPAALAAVSALTTLAAVEDGEAPGATARDLAPHVPVGVDHLRRRVLPGLSEMGWVSQGEAGRWRARLRYLAPLRQVMAVEVKRGEWRRALGQAVAHTAFADSTYVALDAARTPPLATLAPAFASAGVGLISVRASGRMTVERQLAARRRRAWNGAARALVGERVLALAAAGTRAGSVGPVFGRFFTTSAGSDPRLVGADPARL